MAAAAAFPTVYDASELESIFDQRLTGQRMLLESMIAERMTQAGEFAARCEAHAAETSGNLAKVGQLAIEHEGRISANVQMLNNAEAVVTQMQSNINTLHSEIMETRQHMDTTEETWRNLLNDLESSQDDALRRNTEALINSLHLKFQQME